MSANVVTRKNGNPMEQAAPAERAAWPWNVGAATTG